VLASSGVGLSYSSSLKMEEVYSSEMSVNTIRLRLAGQHRRVQRSCRNLFLKNRYKEIFSQNFVEGTNK
jgi:hypothetical protein